VYILNIVQSKMEPITSGKALRFVVVGAGVVGLSTALALKRAFPTASLRIISKYFPGDKNIAYTSPWAGANWLSAATDGGRLENYDRITFQRFEELVKTRPDCGLKKLPLRAYFDQIPANAGILSENTGKIWYESLVNGIKDIPKENLPPGAIFGLDIQSTFVINVPVYLAW
jgi:D-amino-acid oxidase